MLAASDGELAWKADTAIRKMLGQMGWHEATANYFENECKEHQATIATLKRAVDLTLPLMERYEGQGEGGIAEFNIAIEALRRCKS